MKTANTTLSDVNEFKLYLFFSQIYKKYTFWCAAEFLLLVYECHEVKKVENL